MSFSFRRVLAFLKKESIQVLRDPSSILIAVILPLILLFLFGFGFSLDATCIRIGVVMEDTAPEAQQLYSTLSGSPYLEVVSSTNRKEIIDKMVRSDLRGMIVIPSNFSEELRKQVGGNPLQNQKPIYLQVIADGSEPNTANFVQNYIAGALQHEIIQWEKEGRPVVTQPILSQPRTWFNPELHSRYTLLSGALSVIMTLIVILLTALVVAREWERGSMESIMSTPLRTSEFLLGKLVPYYLLGIGSMIMCVVISQSLFDLPFRGSYFVLFFATTVFLLAGLGIGLFISSLVKNQFVATQFSIMLGFIPSFMLSGFIYQISSMPKPIQLLTYFIPAKYFVSTLQTLFLVGNIWSVILPNLGALCLLGGGLFILNRRNLQKRLEEN